MTRSALEQHMRLKSTDELRAIVEAKTGTYTHEATEAARIALAERGNETEVVDAEQPRTGAPSGGSVLSKVLAVAAALAVIRELVRLLSHYFQ